ncbi:MAG: alcohol dehydrogenase catalytic domain-containing protein, partial [Dehalococcoidia bacterium]|nr:alcohol dehydrogenase catalytic domain-containing protein [Dehalococcoidia bacterium]
MLRIRPANAKRPRSCSDVTLAPGGWSQPLSIPVPRSTDVSARIMPAVSTMRAVSWAGPRAVEVIERELTDPPPGWVRLRVVGAGICGSDLHSYRRGGPAVNTPGHEVGGVVEAVGDGVELDTGANVSVEPVAVCFQCYECLIGQTWHCQNRVFLGGDGAGGMAEAMLAPATSVYALPDRVSPADGSLAEPVAVAVHAVNEAGIRLGTRT